MVGKVLRSHGVVYKDKNYFLTDFEKLDDSQKNELVRLCEQKIKKFLVRPLTRPKEWLDYL